MQTLTIIRHPLPVFETVTYGLLPLLRQIAANLPANALHRLKSDLGVITTKTVSWPIQRVEQIVQANDQWLQMSGNIRQLSELGWCQMPTPQVGTKSQLVWLHCMPQVKLAIATNAQSTDEEAFQHAAQRMLFTFKHRQCCPQNCACYTNEGRGRSRSVPMACHILHKESSCIHHIG